MKLKQYLVVNPIFYNKINLKLNKMILLKTIIIIIIMLIIIIIIIKIYN